MHKEVKQVIDMKIDWFPPLYSVLSWLNLASLHFISISWTDLLNMFFSGELCLHLLFIMVGECLKYFTSFPSARLDFINLHSYERSRTWFTKVGLMEIYVLRPWKHLPYEKGWGHLGTPFQNRPLEDEKLSRWIDSHAEALRQMEQRYPLKNQEDGFLVITFLPSRIF